MTTTLERPAAAARQRTDAAATARAHQAAATDQHGKARADLNQANLDLLRAQARLTDPAADLVETLAAVDDATAHIDSLTRLVDASEPRWKAAAAAAHMAEMAVRHVPIIEAGRDTRISACRKAEAARKVLAEAEAEHAAATARIDAAYSHYQARHFDGGLLHQPMRTEAAERSLWEQGH